MSQSKFQIPKRKNLIALISSTRSSIHPWSSQLQARWSGHMLDWGHLHNSRGHFSHYIVCAWCSLELYTGRSSAIAKRHLFTVPNSLQLLENQPPPQYNPLPFTRLQTVSSIQGQKSTNLLDL